MPHETTDDAIIYDQTGMTVTETEIGYEIGRPANGVLLATIYRYPGIDENPEKILQMRERVRWLAQTMIQKGF